MESKILLKKIWGKFFFLAIFDILMAALDAQQNFMLTEYILFLFITTRSKVFREKIAKVEHILSVIAID